MNHLRFSILFRKYPLKSWSSFSFSTAKNTACTDAPQGKMALTIPVYSEIPSLLTELTRVLPDVNFLKVTQPASDNNFFEAEILICDLDVLGPLLYSLPKARWVQATWAGVDKLMPYVKETSPVPFMITRFTGDHFGKIMGEYVVASIINHERNFFMVKENQRTKVWSTEGRIERYRPIYDLTIGILGLGAISTRIGQMLHFLRGKVLAYGRRPSLPQDQQYSHISRYYTSDNLADFLAECDYVVNVLPSTPTTKGLLDNEMLEHCKCKGAVFINIGRGDIVSESSIIEAINNNWISGAVLDVFVKEPLPETSPLWQMDKVTITPHVAGVTRAKDIADYFKNNFELYQNNKPLPAQIDFNKGY